MRTAMVDAYQRGASIRDLCRQFGLSYGCVHRILTEAGVTLRQPGRYPRKRNIR
jgi:hypothetical protein